MFLIFFMQLCLYCRIRTYGYRTARLLCTRRPITGDLKARGFFYGVGLMLMRQITCVSRSGTVRCIRDSILAPWVGVLHAACLSSKRTSTRHPPPAQNGETPLHRAAYQGREEVAAVLLEAGADTEITDNVRRSAACATPAKLTFLPLFSMTGSLLAS